MYVISLQRMQIKTLMRNPLQTTKMTKFSKTTNITLWVSRSILRFNASGPETLLTHGYICDSERIEIKISKSKKHRGVSGKQAQAFSCPLPDTLCEERIILLKMMCDKIY